MYIAVCIQFWDALEGRQSITVTAYCLCCLCGGTIIIIMIHESQLCFHLNQRLVSSKGQWVWWLWCGWVVGRHKDKATSVCNTKPKERESDGWLATMHRNKEICMYVCAHIHTFWHKHTCFYKWLPITEEIRFIFIWERSIFLCRKNQQRKKINGKTFLFSSIRRTTKGLEHE